MTNLEVFATFIGVLSGLSVWILYAIASLRKEIEEQPINIDVQIAKDDTLEKSHKILQRRALQLEIRLAILEERYEDVRALEEMLRLL